MLGAGLPARPVTGASTWRGVCKGGVGFDRDRPHEAAVPGLPWRGCAAWPIGVVCPDSGRAHDASIADALGGLAGRSLRRIGHARPGQLGHRWSGPGEGQQQRAEAGNRGRNAPDRGRKQGQGLHWPLTRSRQRGTRTDSARPVPTARGWGGQTAPDLAACTRARSRIFASGAKKQRS